MKKIFLFLCIAFSFSALAAKDLTGVRIYVNPGHGGYDITGNTNTDDRNVASLGHPRGDITGFWESASNLSKGLHLRDHLLEHNATVKISRTTNTSADDWGMLEIVADANTFNPDAFLAIHSNATGAVPSTANYPFLIYQGWPDPQTDTIPYNRVSKNMCIAAYPYILDNPLTVWSTYYPYNPNNICIGPNAGGVQMYLNNIPGFLSEGEHHDYLPETCRLLNDDYRHLESLRFLRYFLAYFGADSDTTGTLAGYVKGKDEQMPESSLFYYRAGTDDQWTPLNGAEVILRNEAGDSINSYTVDNNYNGIFVFYNLTPGNYQLEARAANHVSQTVDIAVAPAVTTNQKIFLQNDSAQIAIPRIYASELSVDSTGTGYDFHFTLNTDATSGDIILKSTATSDSVLIPFASLSQGRKTVSINNTQAPAGQYTWEVKASASTVTSAVKFSDDISNPLLNFYTAHGISIDNDFDSPYFGRIYVTSFYQTGTTLTGRTTSPGIYILDAALMDVTGQGNTPYTGNISWAPGSLSNIHCSPNRCCVAPDGQLYIADFSDPNSGVFVMDPANPNNAFRQVFGGIRAANGLFQSGGVNIGGSVIGISVLGKGDNTQLFTMDEDYGNGATNPFGLMVGDNILRYDLGTSVSSWLTGPSAAIFDNAAAAVKYSGNLGALQYNGNSSIAPDARGGWFISQNRNPGLDDQVVPSLIHISPSTTGLGQTSYNIDFNSGDPAGAGAGFIGGSLQAGMAVSYDGNMLAINYSNEYKVYNVTYNASGAPTLTKVYDIFPGVGDAYSMTFDRAGNLYVITTASTLGGYSFPIANNSFITPAPLSQVINLTNTGIIVPKQSPKIQVYPNPIQNVVNIDCEVAITSVKLIDLTGRMIMDVPINQKQMSINVNISGLPAGTYILFVNNTPVKVEKK